MASHEMYDPEEPLSDSDVDDMNGHGHGPQDEEQDEEEVEEQLRQELERLRGETAMALKKSWAEVEQLQSEGAEGKEKVSQLERELDALRAQNQHQSPPLRNNRATWSHHRDDWQSSSSSEDEYDNADHKSGGGGGSGGVYMVLRRTSVRGGELVTGSRVAALRDYASDYDDSNNEDDYNNGGHYSERLNDADDYARHENAQQEEKQNGENPPPAAGEGRRRRRFSLGGVMGAVAMAPTVPEPSSATFERRSSDYSESGVMYGRRLSSQQGTDAEEKRRNWKFGDISSDDDDGSDWGKDFEVRSREPYGEYVQTMPRDPSSVDDISESSGDMQQSQVSESALDYSEKMYNGFGGDGDGDAKSVGAVPTDPSRDQRGKRGGRRKQKEDQAGAAGKTIEKSINRRFSMERSGSTRSLAEASLAAVSNMLNLDDSKDDDGIGEDDADADADADVTMDIHDDRREKGAIELGLADQLTGLDLEKQNIIDEMQTKLREKETDIENMERTTSQQAQQISELQAELDQLREQAEEEEKKAIVPDISDLREEIEKNRMEALALERQVSDAEYRLEARKEREQILTSALAQILETIKSDEENGTGQLKEMGEHLRKANASRAKYEEENRSMRQKTDDILAKLRADFYDTLSDGGSTGDAFANLMAGFQELREKEEELGEVLVSRMQEREEVVNALEAIKEIRDRSDLGQMAAQEVMQKLISSLNSINFDNNVLFSRFAKKDERTESMKKRHEDAIASLEALGEIQKETHASLGFMQTELAERLALFEWNKEKTDIADNTSGTSFTTADDKNIVDTMEDAERIHKEAKGRLNTIRDDIRSNLIGSIDNESVHSKITSATAASADDDEDEVFRLEEEISSKDEKIESLQSTAEKLTEQIASLKKELAGTEEMGERDKAKAVDTIERLQKKVQEAVVVSKEREVKISNLQATLQEKKESEGALESELSTTKVEALHSQINSDSDDMPEEDLPAALDHVGL